LAGVTAGAGCGRAVEGTWMIESGTDAHPVKPATSAAKAIIEESLVM
jgi:hypothetical protein